MFWIFTILSATILGRGRYRGDNLNLHLFWTFRYAWTNHSWRHWYDIIGNMMLFLPLGIILPSALSVFRRLLRTFSAGLILSVFVEVYQYFTHTGLCELDDIFNNTYGVLLGFAIWVVYRKGICRKSKLLAEIMMPQSKSSVLTTYDTLGVVVTWRRQASAPEAVSPAARAYSNI